MSAREYGGQKHPGTYLTTPRNNTPSEVRRYLVSILVQNHGCSIEEANEVASVWTYGRGSDFYQYDLETFKEMFGDEVGMLFFLYSRNLTPGGRLRSAWEGAFFIAIHYPRKEIDKND